jgi:hypothetical protein
MLSAQDVLQSERRRRSPPSLKQQYHEYVLERIEAYKNSMPRSELLRLGDEAYSELQATSEGQFVLTEVLMLDSVDRLIMKRLALKPYRRWRTHFKKLRDAQRQPTRWGLDAASPLAALLPRLEPEDVTLVIGTGAEPAVYLLAAHDVVVTFLAPDLGAVERVETRIASEALGGLFEAYVVQLGGWLPEGPPADVVVLDPSSLADVPAALQAEFLREVQSRTRVGGVHVLLPGAGTLAPEALLSYYEAEMWEPDRMAKSRRADRRGSGIALTRMMDRGLDEERAVRR